MSGSHRVSLFNANIKKPTRSLGTITLEDAHNKIKGSEVLRLATVAIRAASTKKEKNDIKQSQLPYIVPSAIFNKINKRKRIDIDKLTGLISYDFDDIGEQHFEQVYTLLKESALSPILIFVSPSGTGLKVISYCSRLKDYKGEDATDLYKACFFTSLSLVPPLCRNFLDDVANDCTRALFLGFDSSPYYNPDALPMELGDITVKEKTKQKITFNEAVAEILIKNFLKANKPLDVDDSGYTTIIAFLSQFKNTTKADELAIKLLQRMPRHSNPASKFYMEAGITLAREKMAWWILNRRKPVGLISVKHILIRNSDVDALALTAGHVVDSYATKIDGKLDNITRQLSHATPPPPDTLGDTAIDFFCEFVKKRKIFRNSLNGGLLEDMRPLISSEKITLELQIVAIARQSGFTMSEKKAAQLLKSSYIPYYHPIIDLWKVYRDEPLHGAIESVGRCLMGISSEGRQFFKLFIIQAARMVLDGRPNELILSIVGDKNVGKTAFCKHLFGGNTFAPDKAFKKWNKDLSLYLSVGPFENTGTVADRYTRLVDNLGVMVDEFNPNAPKSVSVETYKEFATMTTCNVRRSHRPDSSQEPRRASIFITSNSLEFINDSHDNRRFIPLKITGVDWGVLNNIDIGTMWAEALLLAASEDLKITADLKEWLTKTSSEFSSITTEQDLVALLDVPEDSEMEDERVDWVSVSTLKNYAGGVFLNSSSQRIAYQLNQMGFKARNLRNAKEYAFSAEWKHRIDKKRSASSMDLINDY